MQKMQKEIASKVWLGARRKKQMKFSIVPIGERRVASRRLGRPKASRQRGEGEAAMFSCLWVVGERHSNSNPATMAPTHLARVCIALLSSA